MKTFSITEKQLLFLHNLSLAFILNNAEEKDIQKNVEKLNKVIKDVKEKQ